MKYVIFLSCMLLSCVRMSGQGRNIIGKYIPIESAKEITPEENFSTARLAYSITRNAKTDVEKVTEIYRWITKNISYDNELMRNEDLQREIYTSEGNVIKNVIDRDKALCGGYAFLFQSLCADVGIEAVAIHGFTKDYSKKVKKRKIPNHTWNAVKLGGKWQLLDITWAIGHGSNKKPDNFWFLTDPQVFILSHYPEDPQWSLLKNPLPFSEFENGKYK